MYSPKIVTLPIYSPCIIDCNYYLQSIYIGNSNYALYVHVLDFIVINEHFVRGGVEIKVT